MNKNSVKRGNIDKEKKNNVKNYKKKKNKGKKRREKEYKEKRNNVNKNWKALKIKKCSNEYSDKNTEFKIINFINIKPVKGRIGT